MRRITEAQFERMARLPGFSLQRAPLGHVEQLEAPGLVCVVNQANEKQTLVVNIITPTQPGRPPNTEATSFVNPSALIYSRERGLRATPDKVLITDQGNRRLIIENNGSFRLEIE